VLIWAIGQPAIAHEGTVDGTELVLVFGQPGAFTTLLQTLSSSFNTPTSEAPNTRACSPAADGGAAPGGYADYQGELLLLDGPRGLVEALEQGKGVTTGAGFRTCKVMRMLLEAWLPPSGLRPWYHLFESYRQGGLDSELTEALFHALSRQVGPAEEPVQVFLDKRRLQNGQNFRDDFSKALIDSHIALPVLRLSLSHAC
jgi:hypothetical protein